MRLALAALCFLAARYVPFLATLMSLIGACLTMNISVILPAVFHLRLLKVRMQRGAWVVLLPISAVLEEGKRSSGDCDGCLLSLTP